MRISARNQIRGRVARIKTGSLMAEVVVDVGGQDIVSEITLSSVERLGVKVGDEVWAIIKATDVMIGVGKP